jgi:superfamily II DNA or RNA helicase
MSSEYNMDNYVDLKINGKIFDLFIKANYKKYMLEPFENTGEDPCKKQNGDTNVLRKYQSFVSSYLDFRSPYKTILLYHGLGSGKTISAISIVLSLFNYSPDWNIFILIKASLRDDPWLKDLKNWVRQEQSVEIMNSIFFISYDSPIAEKTFLNSVKSSDATKKNIYIFDEAHNFIKNVYNNLKTSGKRASSIYDYIVQDKKENDSTRIIMLSGTPCVNSVYELALLFNLLKNNVFPSSEAKFNETYISRVDNDLKLNPAAKNMFQRRILGLVSYYIGSDPNLFAAKETKVKNVPMDPYQQQVYEHFEYIEEQLERARAQNKSGATVYRSYTRQSSNFVFPVMGSYTGENRPRPAKFKLTEKEAEEIISGRLDNLTNSNKKDFDIDAVKKNASMYLQAVDTYIKSFISYLDNLVSEDKASGNTIEKDVEIFKSKYKFKFAEFWKEHKTKSKLLQRLYACSCKMTAIIFYMMRSKGPVLIFSNFVKMEGLEIFKIYLSYFSYGDFSKNSGSDYHRYTEFHGEIDRDVRKKNLAAFNSKDNIDGKVIRIILISPAGSEGINLRNVRQVHVMEPYWNEVRIQQLIGRALRMCSHADLPMNERKVDIFRYHAIRSERSKVVLKESTDQEIYNLAMIKEKLIDSFLQTVRESAVDCDLFKNHNMINGEYSCFKFNEKSYFDKYIGPAYKEDIYYDQKMDNGLNALNTVKKKVKVFKIKARMMLDEEITEIAEYWYNPDTGVVYDLELDYPVGRINKEFGLAKKIDATTYLIDEVIHIPRIKRT